MPTISQDAPYWTRVEPPGPINLASVDLSDSQILDLIDRARALKRRQPGFVRLPLTLRRRTGTESVHIDLVHPVHVLADLLTMSEHSERPFEQIAFCCVGDGSADLMASMLLAGAALGMDVRIAALETSWPTATIAAARKLAATSGARLLITSDTRRGTAGADFVVTIPRAQSVATTVIRPGDATDALSGSTWSWAHEQALNRAWVMDAVLADWLGAAPDQLWSTPADDNN